MSSILEMYAKLGFTPDQLKFSKKVVCASDPKLARESGGGSCPFSFGKNDTTKSSSGKSCPFSGANDQNPENDHASSEAKCPFSGATAKKEEGYESCCPVTKASTPEELPDWAKKYLKEKEREKILEEEFGGPVGGGCPVMRKGSSSGLGGCPVFRRGDMDSGIGGCPVFRSA